MQTVKIRLDQKSKYTNNLYEKSIRICNTTLKDYGWFRIKTNKPVTISMKSGRAILNYSPTSIKEAMNSGTSSASYSLQNAGEHFFYINGTFNDYLVFSDITALDTFNATTSFTGSNSEQSFEDNNIYVGLNVYVKDLPKLSLVKQLLVKYSLYGINKHCKLDMRAFKNLEALYLGHSIDLGSRYIDAIVLDSSLAGSFSSDESGTIEKGIKIIYQ